MKHILVVILVILVLLLPACGGRQPSTTPPETFYLSTSVSPSGSGSVSPSSGSHEAGSTVTVTAQPSSGYVFDHWGGDASGTSTWVTITMNSDKSITAHFTYSPQETVSAPSTPSGPSTGNVGQSLTYTTGGSTSSKGYSVEYRFNWGDEGYSQWSSSPSASHSWSSPGNYTVQAQARSAVNTSVLSSWSVSKSVTIEKPSTPLNVRIDYIGVKNAYDSDDPWDYSHSEVQLVVVVTDGKTATPEGEVFIPWDKKGYKMESFETKKINQPVFHTSSVGSYLRISIAAWDIDSKNETLDALSVLEAFGIAGAAEFRTLYDMLPQEDDRIGDYSHTWYADGNWGIGPHEVSDGNFLLGFSIYSDKEPSLILEPSLLPDVKIQSVDMPSEVKQSNPGWYYFSWYSNTLTVVNNEDIPLDIDWDAYSSAKGAIFASGTVTIPANGRKSVLGSYYYDTPLGPLTETYTIYYRGKKLDSWSGTLNVVPGPWS